MPEILIKYKSNKTLNALKDMAKYFDFIISSPVSQKGKAKDVTILAADTDIDLTSVKEIFTRTNLDSNSLRSKAWQREK